MPEAVSIEEHLNDTGSLTYSTHGVSMQPMLYEGRDLFTVASKGEARCKVGDVALYKRGERLVLHRVVRVLSDSYVILGDNCIAYEHGITDDDIIGVLTGFVRDGVEHSVDETGYRLYTFLRVHTAPLRILLRKCQAKLGIRKPGGSGATAAGFGEKRDGGAKDAIVSTTVYDLAYLLSCAVAGRAPARERVEAMDLSAVLREARRHLVEGAAAYAVADAGVVDAGFSQAQARAIRKQAILESERDAVLARLEDSGIWHLPLKGSVLAADYPRFGMRQMTDVDVLVDPERTGDVRAIMEELGFSTMRFGSKEPDIYNKAPVSNFEIHSSLFGVSQLDGFVRYYENVEQRLLPVEGTTWRRRFSDEDFYLFLVAHEYKHYAIKGIGLRALMDTRVFLDVHGDALDWGYIEAEVAKLGMADFERANRNLAQHLLGEGELDDSDREMLAYLAESGAFGTRSHMVDNVVRERGGGVAGKARYVRERVFLPLDAVEVSYPFFYRHKVLLPVLPVYRLGRGLRMRRGQIASEVKALSGKK